MGSRDFGLLRLLRPQGSSRSAVGRGAVCRRGVWREGLYPRARSGWAGLGWGPRAAGVGRLACLSTVRTCPWVEPGPGAQHLLPPACRGRGGADLPRPSSSLPRPLQPATPLPQPATPPPPATPLLKRCGPWSHPRPLAPWSFGALPSLAGSVSTDLQGLRFAILASTRKNFPLLLSPAAGLGEAGSQHVGRLGQPRGSSSLPLPA